MIGVSTDSSTMFDQENLRVCASRNSELPRTTVTFMKGRYADSGIFCERTKTIRNAADDLQKSRRQA